MGKLYVTTPIYYANDFPHAGSAYTTIAADVLARHHRRLGDDTYFLTGTDEHGAKVAEAAAARGIAPREFTDEIVAGFKEAWRLLEITNDQFIRTTDPRHERGVQRFLADLYAKGEIYKGKYEGLYCVGCEAYVAAGDLVDGLCPSHRRAPIAYTEDNYFFRLSKYQDVLIHALTDESDPNHYHVGPTARRNEVLGKLRGGLTDISISRANLAWGIELPFDTTQTAYVWIDALLNYVTAVGYGDDSESFQRYWPADVHLVGKDILWFHAVIWPAMLIAAGLPLPKLVFAHGFFTVNGQKMSKSLGNVIVPSQLVDAFGVDAARYLLLSEFPFGADGDVSLSSLQARYNAELANDLGNLVNRTLSMVNRYFGGIVPKPGEPAGTDAELRTLAEVTPSHFDRHLTQLEYPEAIGRARALATRANKYVEENAPWLLAKLDRARLATVIYNPLETERILAETLWPVMPGAAERLAEQLGAPLCPNAHRELGVPGWGGFVPGTTVTTTPTPLFPRLDSRAETKPEAS